MTSLISAENLTKIYITKDRSLFQKRESIAVDHINLEIQPGESLGLIGESGCGKSTLARLLMGLEIPTEGQVSFEGKRISDLSYAQMRGVREHMQMVFQNSNSVFDPSFSIGNSMIETMKNYPNRERGDYREAAAFMLGKVGLPEDFLDRYPSELSGGQRQRANIARALILHPRFVICDEPVSSLDYSLRKRILDLLNQLKQEFDLTYLFITHDLSTVTHVCSSIAVMYLGKIIEKIDDTDHLEERIRHPYTRALFEAAPRLDRERSGRLRSSLQGDILTARTGAGCCFKERCPKRDSRCESEPKLLPVVPGHLVACHRVQSEY